VFTYPLCQTTCRWQIISLGDKELTMKQHKNYSQELRTEALHRAANRPADQTLEQVASACGVNIGTLKNWLKSARKAGAASGANRSANAFSPVEQLQSLEAIARLSDVEQSAWCRERGLFAHHLQAWRQSLTAPRSEESHALREVRRDRDRLQTELNRKDKALAEAAALMILQKKFQGIFSAEAS